MAKNDSPSTIYLHDYQAPDFQILKTDLEFDLYEDYAIVNCELEIQKINMSSNNIVLHGQELELLDIQLDAIALAADRYDASAELTVFDVPERFKLRTVCKIKPQENTSLEGLYRSHTMFCTQCEAEGFRKITYYLDRPDVLSVFTTKIIADKGKYPVLLSNGNRLDQGELENDRHWAIWNDPFPKPSYLFALVAGNLECVTDSYTTFSGREVSLQLFVEKKDLDKCDHALLSLKNAMKWDEDVYGREYDLDVFMIVAVDDFNMGAMENKGLNIFNTSCVLANPATTTDGGFQRVEAVVAHEYFHNWSGNRVTCRDWFQLSLKEGFTVFRDAEFSADMGSRTVKRVEDVQLLRSYQFAEDAGPMAHPVRPSSFIEISNFYTLTVYEKGAEVVRMIRTLIGEEAFRKGSDLYFERHDGQAVTVEDFVAAMSEASGRDFSSFMVWYEQAGTPEVRVSSRFDQENKCLQLTLEQSCPSTPEASAEDKKPFLIPVNISLLGQSGHLPVSLSSGGLENANCFDVLEFSQSKQEFCFYGLDEEPTVSLLRAFSAPVKIKWNRDIEDLRRIMNFENDGFSRWDAAQNLAFQAIECANFPNNRALTALMDSFDGLLKDESLDPAMVALMLSLPSESYLCEQQKVIDIDSIVSARSAIEEVIAEQLQTVFLAVYRRCRSLLEGKHQDVSSSAIGLRSLQNCALDYLMKVDSDLYQTLCVEQYHAQTNMTNTLQALRSVVHSPFASLANQKQDLLSHFFETWKHESLVVNQWFGVQAANPCEGALDRVRDLLDHPSFDFKNPNKIRSVISIFATQNLRHFHLSDGQGYRFLAEQIMKLNTTNPQIAARLVAPLSKWRRFEPSRGELMRAELENMKSEPQLSKDVFEIVEKSLV